MKYLIKSSYKNNFNYYYLTTFISTFYQKKNIKYKKFFKKTKQKSRLDPRFDSIRRFKNFSFNNQLLSL